ncbi:hypothetical protein F5B19DRAFT_290341 [Rostrohypoxylon terebratum]|nr:hypothetical protein F5B19DRAFT_290341 [Rostrohypoxylon terebratum]
MSYVTIFFFLFPQLLLSLHIRYQHIPHEHIPDLNLGIFYIKLPTSEKRPPVFFTSLFIYNYHPQPIRAFCKFPINRNHPQLSTFNFQRHIILS